MGDNPLLIIGVTIAIGVAINFARLWFFVRVASAPGRVSRIADMDAHLSFDQRIAERMRELEKDGGPGPDAPTAAPSVQATPAAVFDSPAPTAPAAPQGFGRRGL